MGCGRIAPKPELLRIAVARVKGGADGDPAGREGRAARAVLDRAGTMPGRGAYICRDGARGEPARECLALATRRGAIGRALRRTVRLDPELVESVSP